MWPWISLILCNVSNNLDLDMEPLQLSASLRTATGRKKLDSLRQSGKIPAVLYGHRVETRSLVMPKNDFLKLYQRVRGSQLIDLVVDQGAPIKAIVQTVQIDPLTDEPLHVDFHQVNLKEKITATIKLRFTGVAPAVKEGGGVLMTNLNELTVSCLPQDLISEITIDIARLKTFDDYLHVKDLPMPSGVTPQARLDEVVAHVVPPRSEEELKALDQQPTVASAEVPVVGKEEQAHEEGAAQPAAGGGAGKTKEDKG